MHSDFERLVPLLIAFLAYTAVWVLLRIPLKQNAAVASARHYAMLLVGAFALGFALCHLHNDDVAAGQTGPACLPLWLLVASVLGAFGFAFGFLYRQYRFVAGLETWAQPAPGEIAATLARLAPHFGLRRPPVARMILSDRPFACAAGILWPRLYLSRWMVDNLTPSELESVLAHELAHIARRDNLVAFAATAYLGAAAWLPTGWFELRELLRDRELAADEWAVSVTGKPVTLARVLYKAASISTGAYACGLLDAATAEVRIRHLIALHAYQQPMVGTSARRPWILATTLVLPPALAWLVFTLPHLLALP